MNDTYPYFVSALDVLDTSLDDDPKRRGCCEYCIFNDDCDYTYDRCSSNRRRCKVCPRCRHFRGGRTK